MTRTSKDVGYVDKRHGHVLAAADSLEESQQQHLLSPSISMRSETFSITFSSAEQQQNVSLGRRVAQEVSRLTKLSVPLFIQNLLAYSTTVIAVAFVGHLDQPELLSSAVLANSLFNVTGYSLLQGLASGMESLCGQAYGGRSYKTLGLVLQRALLITWAMCIPISLLWTHSEKLLLLLGQQPSIAAGASLYLRIITPTLYAGAVVECLKRYLLAQRVVVPGMVITTATCVLCPLYNWVFIFRLKMGLSGAALAFSCSQGTTAVLLVLYTIWRDTRMAVRRDEEATWCRPTLAVFAGWGQYLSFGLPATIQICTEWWMYEVVIFMAGMAHNAEIGQGVMGLLFQISASAYMSALAYGSSVNTRVGNELGAGNADAARLSVYTGVVVVALVQTVLVVACKLADKQVVGLLSNNEEVDSLTLSTLPILLPTFIFDALNCVAQGILRGAGRPGIGAVLNSAGYWGLGVPLAYLFGLHLGWSVEGFWLALMITSALMAVVQLAVISRFDWDKECERAALLVVHHDDLSADAKAADLAAAMSGAVHVRAVSSSDTGSTGTLQQQQHQQRQVGFNSSLEAGAGDSDTSPLLDTQSSGGGGAAAAAAVSGLKWEAAGHKGNRTQPQQRGSDQGSRPPSRLSRVSQAGQQQHDGSSLDGQLSHAWLQWPFTAKDSSQQGDVVTGQPAHEAVAGGDVQEAAAQQQQQQPGSGLQQPGPSREQC